MNKLQKAQAGQNRMPQQQQKPQPQQAQPKQQSQPKPRVQESEDWDARLLKEVKYFTVVLHDGEKIKAKVIEMNKYHIQVETEFGILLIPKHSIKYYILQEFSEEDHQGGTSSGGTMN